MANHEIFMQRCLQLAELGAGMVSPNPMVGAVVVHEGKIIGEGWHKRYGQAHAEVNAINDVIERFPEQHGVLLSQSTIYVSLEPCAHHGKTPPCADLIIKHHIPQVVVGCRDPFAEVDGKGIEKLIAAGIKVETGILEQDCLWLNRRFFTRVKKHRPYIILKWAETREGIFAPADKCQYWITGNEARKAVHRWRSEEDAILAGKNTVAIDNPQLNVRYWQGRSPKRVIIDRRLELNKSLHVFNKTVETLVFNEIKTDIDGNIKYIALEDFERFVPQYIMFQLYMQDIQSVIVEGGVRTLEGFIEAGLWDEARIFTGANSLLSGIYAPRINGHLHSEENVGQDRLRILINNTSF